MRTPNLHSLAGTAGLGVECAGCGRRSHLSPEALGPQPGDMTELRGLRLVCKVCGSHKVRLALMQTPGTIGLWLAGEKVGLTVPHDSTALPYVPRPALEPRSPDEGVSPPAPKAE